MRRLRNAWIAVAWVSAALAAALLAHPAGRLAGPEGLGELGFPAAPPIEAAGSPHQPLAPALACVWREDVSQPVADACVLDADPDGNYGASPFL
jgi:hypothetical protein